MMLKKSTNEELVLNLFFLLSMAVFDMSGRGVVNINFEKEMVSKAFFNRREKQNREDGNKTLKIDSIRLNCAEIMYPRTEDNLVHLFSENGIDFFCSRKTCYALLCYYKIMCNSTEIIDFLFYQNSNREI